MIRWGLVVAAILIAAGAWFDWSYHAVRTELAELQSRLKDGPGADTTADCARVGALQANPIARLFKSEELAALAARCDEMKSQGPGAKSP